MPIIEVEHLHKRYRDTVAVEAHVFHVYAKLGVSDRAAAVAAAYERGLLTPGGG